MTRHGLTTTAWCVAALAAALVAIEPTETAVKAAAPPQDPTAAFTFDDSPEYDLRSDGRGAYVHSGKGKDGYGGTIDADFTLTGPQANVNLNLVKSGRKFLGAFTFESPGNSCGNPCVPIGDGSFTDGWFLTIYGVPGMYNGETKVAQALFTRGGASTLPKYAYPRFTSYWCGSDGGPNACGAARQNSGSMMVIVTRQDVDGVATWTALAASSTSDPHAGDLSEIIEQTSNTSISRGLYRSSFRVTVQCAGGCSALPYPPQ